MTTALLRLDLDRVVTYVREELPALNRRCRASASGLDMYLQSVTALLPAIEAAVDRLGGAAGVEGVDGGAGVEGVDGGAGVEGVAALDSLDGDPRLALLSAVAMLAQSGERHAQAAGHQPGWVGKQLDGLETALCRAAGGQRAAALTAELYWRRGTGVAPLMFTGEGPEQAYACAVRTQRELRATVNRQIRALSEGWHVDSDEGARMLRVAAAAMRESRCQYMDLRRGGADGVALTPEGFDDVRSWLVPTVVAGQWLDGPDPAHLADMVATDMLLGTADDHYAAFVSSTGRYQSARERYALAADVHRASLTSLFVDALGYSPHAFDRATAREVADTIARSSRGLLASLDAFASLIDHHIGASGAHIGLIGVLLRQNRHTSRAAYNLVAQAPSYGDWPAQSPWPAQDQAHRLHHMRRRAHRVFKLVEAFRQSQRRRSRPALVLAGQPAS